MAKKTDKFLPRIGKRRFGSALGRASIARLIEIARKQEKSYVAISKHVEELKKQLAK